VHLVRPSPEHLASYVAALERGWSADTERGIDAAREELSRIQSDSDAFLASMDDREGKGLRVTLPDGSTAERIPGFKRWMWDGEFCGSIGLRWQPGRTALPPHCLGHIGYAVVPWKQRLGYAKSALQLILPEAKAVGLPYVEITTDPDNVASQRVVEANGGVFVEHFIKPPQFGSKPGLRFRITLT
jgi:predicted acetyltransferase